MSYDIARRVEIKRRITDRDYEDEVIGVEVFIDGKSIGRGGFGGEPEDNSENRDYGWVIPMLNKLAKELGAEVEETETNDW